MDLIAEPPMKGRSPETRAIDRISSLLEPLLCHVLSFLPTKSAVATGILSKRWRLLWTLLPVVDLDDELSSPQRPYPFDILSERPLQLRFQQFVNSVLRLRNSQAIRRFRLKCVGLTLFHYNVKEWVDEALRRKAEELDLFLCAREAIKLQPSVFTCSNVVALKLDGPLYVHRHEISVHLPSLNVLYILS